MYNIKKLLFIFFIVLLVSSCVSKKQYIELETESDKIKDQLETTKGILNTSEISRDKCNKNLTEFKTLYKDLENDNQKLTHEFEMLMLEFEKRKSLLKLQEGVISQLNDTKKQIEVNLKDQIATQEIKLEEMEGKLKVTFVDKILFDSGKVDINKKGKKILKKIAETIKNSDRSIVVEGHTDNVAIGPVLRERFPTNWELSAARATTVVRFLQKKSGIEPTLFSASAYGSHRPVSSNDTLDGQSENRRIEIILAPLRKD